MYSCPLRGTAQGQHFQMLSSLSLFFADEVRHYLHSWSFQFGTCCSRLFCTLIWEYFFRISVFKIMFTCLDGVNKSIWSVFGTVIYLKMLSKKALQAPKFAFHIAEWPSMIEFWYRFIIWFYKSFTRWYRFVNYLVKMTSVV